MIDERYRVYSAELIRRLRTDLEVPRWRRILNALLYRIGCLP